MTRGLTAGADFHAKEERVARTTAIALDFPAGVARWCGLPRDITIGGETFFGVGLLGRVSIAEESAELRAYGLTAEISGIPRDVISLALLQGYQNRAGTLWEVILHPDTHEVIADPIVVFRGRMDTMDITLGVTAMVRVSLENRLTDWERQRIRRYTDQDQQAVYPGDTGFRFVPATTEKEIIWPTRRLLTELSRS